MVKPFSLLDDTHFKIGKSPYAPLDFCFSMKMISNKFQGLTVHEAGFHHVGARSEGYILCQYSLGRPPSLFFPFKTNPELVRKWVDLDENGTLVGFLILNLVIY